MGDQVGYQNQASFSIFNAQTTLMLSTKFQVMLLGEMSNIPCVDLDRGHGVWPPPEKPQCYRVS